MGSSDKNVIMLGCYGGDGKRGGTRTYVESLSSFLSGNGYRIICIPRKQKSRNSYSCLARIKIDSIRMKLPRTAVAIAQGPEDLLMFRRFAGKRNKTICVIHSDNLRQKRLKKSRFIANLYVKVEKQGLKAADRVICVDQGTYDIYVKRYPNIQKKTCVIPVGVNMANFNPRDRDKSRKSLGIPTDARVMLVVARLEKEKNVGAAIELVKKHFDIDNHYLLIVGMGTQEAELKEQASKIKKAKIIFQGQVQYEKLPETISASNVVLVPSQFETGPLIIIEAMACGIPSVSTDVGRARTFIGESGCGAVAKEPDAEFADKVKAFLEPNEALRQKCMERVKKFSFHNTGVETMKLIEETR